MDTVTHALLGALVVRSVFPASRSRQPLTDRQRMAVGAIAGAFPDIDYIASWVDPMVYMTLWHRSITHSFVLLPLWALLVGVALAFAFKQRKAWPFVTALAGVSVLSHIVADLITVAGADRWMTIDLHAGQIQGFFSIPGDEITAFNILSDYLVKKNLPEMLKNPWIWPA